MTQEIVYYRNKDNKITKTTLNAIKMGCIEDLTFSTECVGKRTKKEINRLYYKTHENLPLRAGFVRGEFKVIFIPSIGKKASNHSSYVFNQAYRIMRNRYYDLLKRTAPANTYLSQKDFLKESVDEYCKRANKVREHELNTLYSLKNDKETKNKSWFIVRDDYDKGVGYLAPLLDLEGLKHFEFKTEKLNWKDSFTVIERFYSQKLEKAAWEVFKLATGIDLEFLNSEERLIRDGVYCKNKDHEYYIREGNEALRQNELMFELFGNKKVIRDIICNWAESAEKINMFPYRLGGGYEKFVINGFSEDSDDCWSRNIPWEDRPLPCDYFASAPDMFSRKNTD